MWAAIRTHLDPDATTTVVDLGSGGGVPALVLAQLESWRVVMVEQRRRRVDALELGVAELDLRWQTSVVGGEAAHLARSSLREVADVVTARSFARPGVAAEIGAAIALDGGLVVIADSGDRSDRWPAAGLASLGLERLAASDAPYPVAVLRRSHAPAAPIGRSWAQIARQPVF